MQWSIKSGCAEFGVARETLKQRLIAAGLLNQGESNERPKWSTMEIHRALSDTADIKERKAKAEARKLEAEARMLEQEERVRSGELGEVAEFQRLIDQQGAAIRARIIGWPETAGGKCNPSDQEFAVAALRAEVDALLPLLQSDVRAAVLEVVDAPKPKRSKRIKEKEAE